MNADDAWSMFCQEETFATQREGWLAPEGELVSRKKCVGMLGDGTKSGWSESRGGDGCDKNRVLGSQEIEAPECSPIYISTKTKIGYLNQSVPLEDMFWAINVLPSYAVPKVGIVKKEMKFKTTSREGLDALIAKVEAIEPGPLVQQSVKTHMDADGSINFKDIRKVSVGICKKQMTSFRSKVKGAFFNCFAVILRLNWEGEFKEMHIKVFNTGKLEIPGIPGVDTDRFLRAVLDTLIDCLSHVNAKLQLETPLGYRSDYNETVLTNSNFSANYLIDRQKLSVILKQKYRVLTTYDPCSYPGVQSKFYYLESRAIQDGRPPADCEASLPHIVVPVMIFRTGSVLIVGKFDDDVLMWVYEFVKKVLHEQYAAVHTGTSAERDADNCDGNGDGAETKEHVRKSKKRFIQVTVAVKK